MPVVHDIAAEYLHFILQWQIQTLSEGGKGGGGGGWCLDLLALLVFFPFVISFCYPKIRGVGKGGGAGPPGPSPRSATVLYLQRVILCPARKIF